MCLFAVFISYALQIMLTSPSSMLNWTSLRFSFCIACLTKCEWWRIHVHALYSCKKNYWIHVSVMTLMVGLLKNVKVWIRSVLTLMCTLLCTSTSYKYWLDFISCQMMIIMGVVVTIIIIIIIGKYVTVMSLHCSLDVVSLSNTPCVCAIWLSTIFFHCYYSFLYFVWIVSTDV